MQSRGKEFEKRIRLAFEQVSGVSVDRFADPMGGYSGHQNFCDLTVYQKPYKYYFECKERKGNTLNFKNDITERQWEGLIEKAKIRGVLAGVLVWFQDHNYNIFVPIHELSRLREEGYKSLNVKDIIDKRVDYVNIPGKKKRIFYTYDGETFLSFLRAYASRVWRERAEEDGKERK